MDPSHRETPPALRMFRAFAAWMLFLALSAAIAFPFGLPFLRASAACDPTVTRFSAHILETPPNLVAQGLAWGDYDNDGWDDLFVAAYPSGDKGSASRLYQNREGTLVESPAAGVGLPEDLTASSGFFADYDNDGWVDLFVVETAWPKESRGGPLSRLRVFVNRNGTFSEETDALGLGQIKHESNAGALTFADFDNDGDLDIAVAFHGTARRYDLSPLGASLRTSFRFGGGPMRYIAGREEVERVLAEEPELAEEIDKSFGREAFLAKRGFLVATSAVAPGIILPFQNRGTMLVFAGLPGELLILRNDRELFRTAYTFVSEGERNVNQTAATGLAWPHHSRHFWQPAPLYLGDDDRIDLFVATDFGRSLLLENQGEFRFRDVTAERDLAVFGTGMGVALGDSRRSGVLDLAFTNFGRLFRFQPEAAGFWLDPHESPNRLGFGWGITFLDYDNDGWVDLYVSNGWPRFYYLAEEPSERPARHPLFAAQAEEDRLYQNQRGQFLNRTRRDICPDQTSTFPVATADINRDGATDLALGTVFPGAGERSVTLFQNNGSGNHFVQIKLEGTRSNRDGIGAMITVVTADGSRQSQLVLIGESFYAQHSLTKTFGLSSDDQPVTVEVHWPSGILQRLTDVLVGTRLRIVENRS